MRPKSAPVSRKRQRKRNPDSHAHQKPPDSGWLFGLGDEDIPDRVLSAARELSRVELSVLALIAWGSHLHPDRRRLAHRFRLVVVRHVAAQIGASEDTVRAALARLVELGLLEREDNGRRRPAGYRLRYESDGGGIPDRGRFIKSLPATWWAVLVFGTQGEQRMVAALARDAWSDHRNERDAVKLRPPQWRQWYGVPDRTRAAAQHSLAVRWGIVSVEHTRRLDGYQDVNLYRLHRSPVSHPLAAGWRRESSGGLEASHPLAADPSPYIRANRSNRTTDPAFERRRFELWRADPLAAEMRGMTPAERYAHRRRVESQADALIDLELARGTFEPTAAVTAHRAMRDDGGDLPAEMGLCGEAPELQHVGVGRSEVRESADARTPSAPVAMPAAVGGDRGWGATDPAEGPVGRLGTDVAPRRGVAVATGPVRGALEESLRAHQRRQSEARRAVRGAA